MIGRLLTIGVVATVLAVTVVMGEQAVRRDEGTQRTTVIYWEKWTGDEAKEMRKVVDAFNKSQDKIYVRYLSISGVDQKTKLATAGGHPPDIAGIWQDQLCQMADEKSLMDLRPMAEAAGLNREYYIPAYYDALTYEKGLWALPSTPASVGLHVRPDLVPAEYASPETFPKTLEGLDELTRKISIRKPDGRIQMAAFLPSNPGWWNWAWPSYFGGKLIDGDKITIDTPEARRALNWYASYSKQFGAQEVQTFQSGFANFASPQDPFMDGKVAAEMNGVWKANYIRVYKPGLKWFAVPMPYPADRPDLAGHANLSQDVLAIPRGAAHPKEAFEFIKFVQRQDVMEGLCAGHGKNSPLAKVSEKFFATHPNRYIRLFDELARSPKAFSPPMVGIFPQISSEMNVAFQQVSTGAKTPEVALADAQKRLEGLWATYRKQILGVRP